MKTIIKFPFVVFFLLLLSCQDKMQVKKTVNVPKYLPYEQLRVPVHSSQPFSLQKPGKIYLKDDLIFINEDLRGIHVFDNSDPSHPVNLGYLDIPGNVDMAVRGDILYADSYVDLVALDISDPANIQEVGRAKKIFPYILPPTGNDYPIDYTKVDETKGVVIGWKVKKVVTDVEITTFPPWYGPYPFLKNTNSFMYSEGMTLYHGSSGGSGTGIGGSMARFTIVKDWLYALTDQDLRVINISDPYHIRKENVVNTNSGMETIFPYDTLLFLGSTMGMWIYSLSDPLYPQFLSNYTHIRSCDPVVVKNDFAYVTLRSGSTCGAEEVNRLDVFDISDPAHIFRRGIYPLQHPYGLSAYDSALYVCDGEYGMKMYDISDPLRLARKKTYSDIRGRDVIAWNDVLIMIGNEGLSQYRIMENGTLELLSFIPVSGTPVE